MSAATPTPLQQWFTQQRIAHLWTDEVAEAEDDLILLAREKQWDDIKEVCLSFDLPILKISRLKAYLMKRVGSSSSSPSSASGGPESHPSNPSASHDHSYGHSQEHDDLNSDSEPDDDVYDPETESKRNLRSMRVGRKKLNGALGAHKEKQTVSIRQQILALASSANVQQFSVSALMDVAMTADAEIGFLFGSYTDALAEFSGAAAEGAALAAVGMASVEVMYHTVRYFKGEIETGKEFAFHVAKSVTASVGMGLGNWGGGTAGAFVGSFLGPFGTLIGGLVGGIAGGLIGAKMSKSAFDKLFGDLFGGDKEQAKRSALIKDALLMFDYPLSALENEQIFNKCELAKRYRRKAKKYHPDRNGNSAQSHSDFHTLNAAYGCLLALVQKKNKKEVIKQVKEIQLAITWD